MMLAKFRINRLAAGKPFLGSVPKADARLAQLPAEVHFVAAEQRGEIDQPDVQIFDQTTGLLNFWTLAFRRSALWSRRSLF
jgi:hypothetical protein